MTHPVAGSTLQLPSPGIASESPGAAVPTMCTVAGSIVPSMSVSLASMSMDIDPSSTTIAESATGLGASFTGAIVTV